MGIKHTAVSIDGIGALECFGAGQQCLYKCVHSIIVGVIGVDISTQHRSICQHSRLIDRDTNDREHVDIPGDLTAALGHTKDRMATGNIKEGNIVYYNPSKIFNLNYKGQDYIVCNIIDILCVLE